MLSPHFRSQAEKQYRSTDFSELFSREQIPSPPDRTQLSPTFYRFAPLSNSVAVCSPINYPREFFQGEIFPCPGRGWRLPAGRQAPSGGKFLSPENGVGCDSPGLVCP